MAYYIPQDEVTGKPIKDNTQDTIWVNFSSQVWEEALAHVKVYFDNFIRVVQGGQEEIKYMTRHLFQLIDSLFCPNDTTNINQINLISIKN